MKRVGILGAGLSGVLMGMQLRRAGFDDFVIYEKQADVGGTWLRNTWPGLHCDVPSHLYCYSFEPNPGFSEVYAGQPEIQAYLRGCAEKYDLIDSIRFGSTVNSARFDNGDGLWTLETDDGQRLSHQILISATGGLTEPNLPAIDGLGEFDGPMWHSAVWRHDVDLAGQRVAVIGSAASAVGVVPAVAEVADSVVVFSRTPNWVVPRKNARYSDEAKTALKSDSAWRTLRRQQYRTSLFLYRAFKKDEKAIAGLRWVGMQHMRSAIDDPALIEALTPDYDPGCKRILVSDDYYPTLALPHVRLVPEGVTALTRDGVVAASGSETPVDVIIFCTGYKLGGRADGRPAVDVCGRDGQHLTAALAARPEAYRGVAVPGFPNYFTVCGINGVVAYAPFFLSAELGTEYISRWVRLIVDDDLRSVEVRAAPTHSYNEAIQSELQDMSWAGDCPSFYRDHTGRILSFFPGTLGRMRRELRTLRVDDFRLERPELST